MTDDKSGWRGRGGLRGGAGAADRPTIPSSVPPSLPPRPRPRIPTRPATAPVPDTSDARSAQASIWVSGGDGLEVAFALHDVARESLAQDLWPEGPTVLGSWFHRFVLWSKPYDPYDPRVGQGVSRIEAEEGLRERLAEAARQRADSLAADSVVKLINALDKHDEAVVVFSRTVIVKHGGKIVVKELGASERRLLEGSPEAIKDPQLMMDVLSKAEHSNLVQSGSQRLPQPPRADR